MWLAKGQNCGVSHICAPPHLIVRLHANPEEATSITSDEQRAAQHSLILVLSSYPNYTPTIKSTRSNLSTTLPIRTTA
ncbi:unnamed protein product [Diplocarpon coronariae]